jgi:hypothetical protein
MIICGSSEQIHNQNHDQESFQNDQRGKSSMTMKKENIEGGAR